MKLNRFFLGAVLLACFSAWTADRAVIVDPTPAPAVAVAPAPPQTVRIEVVSVPAPVPAVPVATPGSIPGPVGASNGSADQSGSPAITLAQVETAVQTAITHFQAVKAANPADPWWKDLVQAVIAAALSLGALLIGWVSTKINSVVEASKLAAADKAAIEALNAGVTSAEQNLYDDFVERSKDGSISDADAATLRAHALDIAKQVATGPGLAALKEMALPRITDYIERILLQRKALAAQADGTVIAPVPVAPIPATA